MRYPLLGSRHLEVLQYLWLQETATPGDIRDYFSNILEIPLCPNTISTFLGRMTDQKLIERVSKPPKTTYRPLVTREQVLKVHLQQLTDTYFNGERRELSDYLKPSE